MFPLYDTVRSRTFPLINLTLVLANVLAFLYELRMEPAALNEFIFTWGLIPLDSSAIRTFWETIFSSMFLHGGWFHIINNMWVLLIFGDNVEAGMGKIRYLFLFVERVAAGLLQTTSCRPVIAHDRRERCGGGVLGAYLILFPLTDCQPGAHPVYLYHCGNPGDAVPALLVRLAALFRLVAIQEAAAAGSPGGHILGVLRLVY